MRILVLRGGALGDFIVSWPALRALRRHWPAAHIELVGNLRAAQLAIETNDLSAAHSQHEARWAPMFIDAPLPGKLREWLDGFDVILNFWPDPDGVLARHFSRVRARVIAPGANVQTRPAAAHFCVPLLEIGIAERHLRLQYEPSETAQREADFRLDGFADFVAIHPGSGSPRKNWPVDRWQRLAEKLDGPILTLTGEAEPSLPALSSREIRGENWPLPVLAAALNKARLFLGHDTGVSHLAAAVGVPCILLFGPTDPEIWAPQGDHVRVIRRGSETNAISVEDVLAELPTASHRTHERRARM